MKDNIINKLKINNKNGITLIALVITIIVMLILVAVTITMAVNGKLFDYAGQATHDTELAKQDELKIAEGSLVVDGNLYNSPQDFIDGIEATPKYSPSLLDSNKVLTKTVEYTDKNGETAIIPKGYGIVQDCEIVNKGLVISDEFDSNGNSIGNEFVWIPVPEKDMQVVTLSNPYVNGNYAEPKELTSTDNNTSSQTGGPFKYDSQEELDYYYGTKTDGITPYFEYETDFAYEAHYKEMAESVNKYGGFYIGRYETTIDSSNRIGCKYNTTVLTSDKKISETNKFYRWWGLYYVCRHANIEGNESVVQTNMVWGQQWDKMIAYFDSKSISYSKIDLGIYNKPNSIQPSGKAEYINISNNEDIINDKIYNIYDLRMNAWDWTAEASYTNCRVKRGGHCNSSKSASYRSGNSPDLNGSGSCTRLTLYIR